MEKLQGRNTKLGSEVDPMLNGNSNHHNGSNGHQHLANGFGGAKRMVNGSAKFIKVRYMYIQEIVQGGSKKMDPP